MTMQAVDPSEQAGEAPMGDPLSGGCFCGAVRLTVSGEPVAMGYCQ